MPTKSIEKVATGLMLLRDGLGPFVEREINTAVRSGRLAKGDVAKYANDMDLFDRRISDWDVSPLLRVMFSVWNDAFRELLGPSERSLVSELRTWRNRWAHQERLTDDDADRILDSVERLLTAVGAPEATRAKAIKEELRRERYAADEPPPSVPVSSSAPPLEVGSAPAPAVRRPATKAVGVAAAPPAVKKTAKKAAKPTAPAKRTTTSKADSKDRAFKVVCWMKPEEAQVVAEAYATQQPVRMATGAGTEVEAVWHEPDHPDAVKYLAGVCMLRHRRSGDPRRMWIRQEEALAVLAAYESAATVEYEHAQHGSGGRAVHHPDDAPEVGKYLANVMLTRYR